MKKATLTLFSLFIAFLSINAQSNFRPGYIISNEMDTVSGLIDFRTYKMNAQACKFKLSEMSEEKIYYPGSIYGYRIPDEGKYYVSKDIEIAGEQKTVFLEYLVQGIISLYFYSGDESDYYFFRGESGEMIPVTRQNENEVTGGETGKKYYSEDNRYKGVIRYIFKDSESISKAVGKMPFNQKAMIGLTKKYHAEMCTTGEDCIEFATISDKYIKMKVSVYAGMRIQTFQSKRQYFETEERIKISRIPELSSLSPEIGIQLNSSIPRWNKSISFQIDVSFAQFKDDREIEVSPQEFSRLKIDGLIASVKLGGKYTYHQGLVRPLIEGGFMMNNLFVKSNFYYGFKYASDPSHYHYPKENFLGSSPYSMPGLYIGTGLDYHLKKDNALLFRIVYDNCLTGAKDMMSVWSLKAGYTF